jgi:ferredoxin
MMDGPTVLLPNLAGLFDALHDDGRRIVGPTVSDGAIVLAEIGSPADLPYGWGVEAEAGEYRLRPVSQRLAFANSAGPQSWKRYLQPPRELLWGAARTEDGFSVDPDEEQAVPWAFLGVRPCDVRAIRVLDRALGDGRRYARRRAAVLLIAMNCTEPGATCFCVSAGGGPRAEDGYDIALSERSDGSYLAEAGTAAGAAILGAVHAGSGAEPAPPEVVAATVDAVAGAADRMGRHLPPGDLRAMLAERREHPQWTDVANRCLACGNCTLVCPTCFCTTVSDSTDLTGDHAERWQRWDSCFDVDFSYMHGGPVRASTASRYRQWLSHKFGAWHDQFGESGCVGCGRCIAWCPVGIDITAELTALATGGEP